MHFCSILSITLSFSIAIAASTTKTSCGPSEDSDDVLLQFFDSLQKWADKRVNEETGGTFQRPHNLEGTIRELKLEVNALKTLVGESQNNMAVGELKILINELREQLSKYQDFGSRLDNLEGQIFTKFEVHEKRIELNKKVIDQLAAAGSKVQTDISQCITDIRYSASEYSKIFLGPGYRDDEANLGYVITGVINWEKDIYPDAVYRRKVSFKRNNAWIPLHE